MHSSARIAFILIFATAQTACAMGGDSTDDFVGTWMQIGGQTTVVCGGTATVRPFGGTDSLAHGIDSDLVETTDGCTTKLDVADRTATARAGQTCTSVQDGQSVTTTVNSQVYSLSSDGKSMSATASATALITGQGGVMNCTASSQLTYTKVSR